MPALQVHLQLQLKGGDAVTANLNLLHHQVVLIGNSGLALNDLMSYGLIDYAIPEVEDIL